MLVTCVDLASTERSFHKTVISSDSFTNMIKLWNEELSSVVSSERIFFLFFSPFSFEDVYVGRHTSCLYIYKVSIARGLVG